MKKNMRKYENNFNSISFMKETKEIIDLRKQLNMKEVVLIERSCLRCNKKINVYKHTSVYMCSNCRICNDAKTDNFTY